MRSTVIKKIIDVFPKQSIESVLAQLDRYGSIAHEPERDRVHLAILKLCHEANLHDPEQYIQAAKKDYRDVLAWAENPGQMKIGWSSLTAVEQAEIIANDKKQYLAWLNFSLDKDNP